MSAKLRAAEQKWARNTKARFKKFWPTSFRSGQTYDSWAKGIADFLGISPATVKKSLPAANFRAAQRNAGAYLQQALRNIDAAARTGAWSKGLKAAFGASASAGVARPRKRRKKRKTTGKKKTTKKKGKKKKGGSKKVYSTKSAAKSAATKGRYPYKVKGGWSLSKKQKK